MTGSPAGSPEALVFLGSQPLPTVPCTERSEWRTEDPQFLAEVLFAVTSMLSFTRLAYILPAHESLGTLQISIGRMIDDMIRCVLPWPPQILFPKPMFLSQDRSPAVSEPRNLETECKCVFLSRDVYGHYKPPIAERALGGCF